MYLHLGQGVVVPYRDVLALFDLDNTSAAEKIPKDARGRFITGDGTVFQGYLFDEERF